MRYRTLGRTGLRVSEVGLGTSKGLVEKLSREEGERLIARAIELGINFIDTARCYAKGEAEARVGQAIKGQRDKVYVCTKCGHYPDMEAGFSRKGMLEALEASLQKLGTDYVDVYLLHSPKAAQLEPGSEAIQTLVELKEKGKVRFIGASLDWPGELWQGLEQDEFDVLEISYNIAELYPEEGFFEACQEKQVGLVIKEPLAVANFYRKEPFPRWRRYLWERLQHYEFLKDESRTSALEVALRFVLSSPYIHTAIQATSNIRHLEFNCRLSDGRKLPEDIARQVRECYHKAVSAAG